MINVKVRLFANLRDDREKEMKISTKKEATVLDIYNTN